MNLEQTKTKKTKMNRKNLTFKKALRNAIAEFRHKIPPYKSRKYLRWVKNRFPDYEIHHILGSHIGKKNTDYLVVPLAPDVHRKMQRYYYKFFPMHITPAVLILLHYAKEVYQVELEVPDTMEQMIEIIETIHKLDKREL